MRNRVIIIIEDGLVQQVQASDPEAVDVVVIDLDADGNDPEMESSIENPYGDEPGETVQAYVSRWTEEIFPLTSAAQNAATDHFGPA